MDLRPFGDVPRFGRLQRLVQLGRMMGVQVVHHQYNPVLVSIVHVHQLLDHPGPIGFRAPVRNFNPPGGPALLQALPAHAGIDPGMALPLTT